MHIKSNYSWLKHSDFMLIDLISLICAFTISYRLKFKDFRFIYSANWMGLLVIILLVDVVLTLIMNPYSGILRRAFYEEIAKTGLLAVYNFIIATILFYLLKIGVLFSREMLIEMYLIYFVMVLFLKYFWKKMLLSGKVHTRLNRPIKLFIISSSDRMDEIKKRAEAGDFKQYEIVGSCDETKLSDYADYCVSNDVNEVLIAEDLSKIPTDSLHKLIENGIGIHLDIASLLGFETESQQISHVGSNNTLAVGTYVFTAQQVFFLWVKRMFDIIFGLLGCVILVPLTIGVKIAYLASGDKNGIFYTQDRIGENGRHIKILKYRTMVTDADKKLDDLLKNESNLKEWQENQKLKDDPRITSVGKFLRRTSLDEFPQFINVLKGEMSIVGPRPLVAGELEAHNGLKLYRRVKPGITGWWACNGRSNIDYHERLDLEYYYIKHFSLYLDILCILRTIAAVFKKEGAE